MPKLPVVSGPEAIRALRRGGFKVDRQSGSHVTLRHPETNRRATVPCHSGRDLRAGTLRAVIRDAGLTVEEFRRLLK